MVKMDVVIGNVRQILGREIKLRGVNLLALCTLGCMAQIHRQIIVRVIRRELNAILLAIGVIKGRENDGRSKLTFVDERLNSIYAL